MPHHPPAEFKNHQTPDLLTDEGEILLYLLHSKLSSLAFDVQPILCGRQREIEEALDYLEKRDPTRARLMRRSLHLAGAILHEAASLLNDGIHWPTIEAMYCPPDDGFIDSPGAWAALAHIQAQNTQNGSAPSAVDPPEPAAPDETPSAVILEKPIRRAAALRSLGRSLRTERESEMRRFYAIAREHGLPTGSHAADAIRAALSELLGEPITSRKQLTARQWGLAGSSIETQDLFWEVAPKSKTAPQPREMAPGA